MKNLEGTNSDIFNLVKKEKEVEYNGLYLRLKTSDLRIRESIAKLKTEYGLISVINRKISLTEKGEKFNNFESYLESLNKNPLNWYRIVPIILSIVFGSISVYFLKANYDLNVSESNLTETNDSLTNDNENLKSELLIHKDSVAELKEQLRLLKLKSYKSTVIAKKKND